MADNILKLRVESSEYDQKLKKAAEGIRHLAEVAHKGGGDLTGLEKAELDYVKALGSMETKSRTAAGGVRELESTFKELTVVYNNLNDVEKQDEGGKALRASLEQIKQRAQEARAELDAASKSLQGAEAGMNGGGGLFSGIGSKMEGALAVFGGNVMTKAAGAVAQLGSEMVGLVQQGIEMAKQGEGVRIAFERMGRGDILQGLREATHGTVTDLELMKAAVKFNDFKLPLDELGTMLAFAQQKAKDTGQSVDYMVDSIVTGLGRKSLMILDNLGLSASEIKERMKETGDMTKAVGAIIRDQMAKAGDYVETAADRAAQANVSLQNKMEELGRKFAPVEEASNQLWTSMKIGILDIIGGPLARMLNELTEAGRQMNALRDINGDGSNGAETRSGKALRILREYSGGGRGIEGKRELYDRQVASFQNQEEKEWRKANRLRDELAGLRKQQKENGLAGNLQPLIDDTTRQLEAAENRAKAFRIARNEYVKGAKDVFNPKTTTTTTTTTTTGPKKGIKEDKDDFTEIIGLIGMAEERVSDLQRRIKEAPDETTITTLRDQLKEAQAELDRLNGKDVDLDKLFPEQSISGASKSWAESMRESLISDLGNSMMAADKSAIQNIIKEGFANGIDLTESGNELMAQLFEGMDVPDDKIKELLEKVNEKIRENGGIELTVDTNTGDVSKKKSEGGPMGDVKKVVSGLNQVASGLQQMGIQLPEGVNQVLGVINGVMTILQGISTIIGVTQFAAITANTISLDLLTAAVWANTASSFIPFAGGGIVHAANGWVGGNSFSGDRVPAMLNSGELVLNRAQQGVLANALEGGNALQNLQLNAVIRGEQIRLVLNNNGRRTGRGEYVQTNRR